VTKIEKLKDKHEYENSRKLGKKHTKRHIVSVKIFVKMYMLIS
jgi:hypothetical protein